MEATGGEEALIICEKEKNPIHLILTDILMPHMSGPQLIRLKQVRQDLKVLYMTRYTDEFDCAPWDTGERGKAYSQTFYH